ncbi:MAG: chemotaxis protein CheW [Planctomycetota bacterium]|nr:chemotaxis protein CheW [Planctomycetota bacterium]
MVPDPRPRDADAASRLLGREPPEAYLAAWQRALKARLDEDQRDGRFSVGLFRLGDELFAVPTETVVEVHPLAPVRSVPGRTGEVFRGLVSLRGEIHLCASLHALFRLDEAQGVSAEEQRLLVVQNDGQSWALIVDEVLDFERFDPSDLQDAQVTVTKSAVHFTNGVVRTPAGPAARVDPGRLFEGLGRSLQ